MTKGTASFGKRHNKTHTICRTTGRSNYHIQKKRSAKMAQFHWAYKAKRRHAPGTGRLRHVKVINRRFHNGFRFKGSVTGEEKKKKKKKTPVSSKKLKLKKFLKAEAKKAKAADSPPKKA